MRLHNIYMAPEDEPTEPGTGEGGGPPSLSSETAIGVPVYDWHTDIHPDVKDDKIWSSIPDVKTLTKVAADNARYAVGAIRIPGKDAKPEDYEAFYTKLGRPASPEGYRLTDEIKDHPRSKPLQAVAHAAGLSTAQWDVLRDGMWRIEESDAKQIAASRDTTVQALQGEWGAAYDRKIALAQRLIRQFGGDETFEALSSNAIGNDVGFLKMVVGMAEAMAEEELITGHVEGTATKEDAQKELDTITNSQVYLNPRVSGHAAAVKRATQLFEILYN